MKSQVDVTDLVSVLTAANRHVRTAIDEHHAAGRSTYFADADGRVFEETPHGGIFEVRNTESGVKRIRLVKSASTALGRLAI